VIVEEVTPSGIGGGGAHAPLSTNDFRGAVAAYERQLLEDALQRNRFNQRATASALGLSYDQLRHALKRHKLQDSGG
jgi:psp operon transcriptional activator